MELQPADPAVCPFDALPPALLRAIVLRLPVDARARCAALSRAWRAFLADPTLWRVLDLSPAGGVPPLTRERQRNLVRGAAHRTAGQLRVFNFYDEQEYDMIRLITEVVTANGAALRELNTSQALCRSVEVRALLALAPQLQLFRANVYGTADELIPMLRNAPPFAALRVCGVHLLAEKLVGPTSEVAAALSAHSSMDKLAVYGLQRPDPEALNALLSAALVRRITSLKLQRSHVSVQNLPLLAQLMHCDSLTTLMLREVTWAAGEQAPFSTQLATILRQSVSLTNVTLSPAELWAPAIAVGRSDVLDAVMTLPALRSLNLSLSHFLGARRAIAGQAVGALLAANLPSLQTLHVRGCNLDDGGLAPLLDGLAANTHLRELDCRYNDASPALQQRMAATMTKEGRVLKY